MKKNTREWDITQPSEPSVGLPEYQFQPYSLNSFLDGNESVLFERLRFEAELYRTFCVCETDKDFATSITTTIQALEYSEYSFVCIYPAGGIEAGRALIPNVLFASYDNEIGQHGGIMFQAGVDSIYHRHLSVVYHFIAGSFAPNQIGAVEKRWYILVVSAGAATHYLAVSGFPSQSCQFTTYSRQTPIDKPSFGDSTKVNPVDVLANAIEIIGQQKFPRLLRAAESETTPKIGQRPLKLLNVLAHQDVTLRDAGDILGLSSDTVNKHMAQAKAALGTKTVYGTIWTAAQQGLINDE